jgi:hypothetical protein
MFLALNNPANIEAVCRLKRSEAYCYLMLLNENLSSET